MSRSYNKHHPVCRNKRFRKPSSVLGQVYIDGVKNLIYRKIKMKPYGRKDFIGYGEEEYCKEFGYYCSSQTNKKIERRKSKQIINEQINEENK